MSRREIVIEVVDNFVGEWNDDITRNNVIKMLSERGIDAICDETNNPPEVVDANTLIVDFYDEQGEIDRVDCAKECSNILQKIFGGG